MKKSCSTILFLLIVWLSFASVGLSQARPALVDEQGYADIVLFNGKIVSMDDRSIVPDSPGHIFEAMAIKGKKIMALGRNDEIKALAGPKTQTVDIRGKTLIPGLIESHAHTWGNAMMEYGPSQGLVAQGIQLTVTTQNSAEATAKAIRDTVVNAIQARKLPKGEWISVAVRDGDQSPDSLYSAAGMWLYLGKITRKSLDSATRDYPVIVNTLLRNMYNGRAIEELKKVFPEWDEHADSENRPGAAADGYEGIMTNVSIGPEYWWRKLPQEIEKIAETFRLHGLSVQKWGVTTISTRIPPPRYISAFYYLNREGKMPFRLAWGLEVHRGRLKSLESTRDIYRTVGAQWSTFDSGNEMMWCDGMTNEIWDSLNAEMCFGPDLPASPEIKAQERCPTPQSKAWVAYKAAILNGWRPVGSHSSGSHGARLSIQMLDDAAKEGGFSTEYIRSLRPTLEHATMIGTKPDVIAGLKKYGITLSVGPRFLVDTLQTIKDYGEAARSYTAPIKTYLNEGIKVVGQMDSATWDDYSNHWWGMYSFITRKAFSYDQKGEQNVDSAPVLVPEEAVDRATALKMWTTWASEYVFAEAALGTLEPGKYADFAVLDRDYFTIPVSEIPKVRVVMTGLNGKVVYDRDQLATAK
ncbi:MAG: amidohydrolase family protein [Acidobacteria bacterium]|nr:amidohydrolase family protein [Acidobacteriota bacterium]